VSTAAAPPPVSITLLERHGHVTPCKGKCTHTGGGLIDVATPSSDTVIITMSGAVLANSEMKFDLEQCFEISFARSEGQESQMTVEAESSACSAATARAELSTTEACAHVSSGPAHLISVCVPPHSVCGCDNLGVNDHDGPKSGPVIPAKYTLQQTFRIAAHSDCCLLKRPSASLPPTRPLTRCGSATSTHSTASRRNRLASR